MPVYRNLNNLPTFKNAVIAVGTFDGVHKGHIILIQQIIDEAKKRNGESVLISFEPHPRTILQPDNTTLKLLTTTDEKTELIERAGVHHIVIAPFTKSFSSLNAREYLENFLVKLFYPSAIVLGYNHQFGHHRDGNIELLMKYASTYNYDVIEIHKQLINDIEVSSTRIRIALLEGDIATANELLGGAYSFRGHVVKGDQRGRTIGYPTANLQLNDNKKLIPARGVYAVEVLLNNKQYQGMMNIGIRPTVDGTHEVIEVNLFDFNQEIYGESLQVFCIARIRNEMKFNSIEQLKEQLHKDKQNALLALKQ